MQLRKSLLKLLFLLMVILFSLQSVLISAAVGSTGNFLPKSVVAPADQGVYVILSGKLFYYDYENAESVFLRDVDLVDDKYIGVLYGTPRRYERYYEMTDVNGKIWVYDDHLWTIVRKQQSTDFASRTCLRRMDLTGGDAVDFELDGIHDIQNAALHGGRLIFTSEEMTMLSDSKTYPARIIKFFDLNTEKVVEPGISFPVELYTFDDEVLYLPDASYYYTGESDEQVSVYTYLLEADALSSDPVLCIDDIDITRVGRWLIYRKLGDILTSSVLLAHHLDTGEVRTLIGEEDELAVISNMVSDGNRLAVLWASDAIDRKEQSFLSVFDESLTLILEMDARSAGNNSNEVPAIQAIQGDLVFLVGGYTSNYTPHMNALYLVDLSQEQPSLQKIVTLDSP